MIVYVHEHKCFYNTKIYTYAGFLHSETYKFWVISSYRH